MVGPGLCFFGLLTFQVLLTILGDGYTIMKYE